MTRQRGDQPVELVARLEDEPADAECALHVSPLTSEDAYGVVNRDVCRIDSTETGTPDDDERAKPALNQ